MKNYEYLFFDLDGTLTNSYEGIKNGLDIVFKEYKLNVPEERYRTFVGPPLTTSFATVFPPEKIDGAIAKFREYYFAKGIFENEVYGGMTDTLERLKNAGKTLYVCTSKRRDAAMTVLDHFGLTQYFDDVFGAIEGGLTEKEDILEFGLDKTGIDRNLCLMIGDTEYDLRGARICGIDCMICSYGFGNYEALAEEDVLWAKNPEEIADILPE